MTEGEKPRRVQLRRTKGWRMPENTVSVARPSAWGNPFPIGKGGPLGRVAPNAEGAVGFFRAMMHDTALRTEAAYPGERSIARYLGGKNLACWCPLDQPCHADVLLELANAPARALGQERA